jgi:translocator protein
VRALLGTALASAAAAAAGTIATQSTIDTWYRTIDKPGYVPPNVVFPVVWTTLFTDIAVSSARTLDALEDAGKADERRAYTAALGVNLALNASWSWLFFKRHRLGTSTLVSAALTASGADLVRRTAAVDGRTGAALSPYPLWCAFATVMTADIWRRNRR